MYEISEREKFVLFRVEPNDRISKLTMLQPETIEALQRAHIEIVSDLCLLAPIWMADIEDVSKEELDKLDAVYRYLFFDAFDNQHG